jgi:MSHA biogenesis protein MshN
MSVINQLLLDLERRRASRSERSVLPDHVRALPEARHGLNWGWIAGGGAIIVVLATAWALLPGIDWRLPPALATPQLPDRTDEIASGEAAAATGIYARVKQADAGNAHGDAPSSRLSFELSATPAPTESSGTAAPAALPAAPVAGRPAPEAFAANTPPAVTAARAEPLKPPAVVAAVNAPPDAPRAEPEIRKQMHQPTPREIAENEYGKGTTLLHQGRLAEAHESFHAALGLHPAHHGARQALVGLLIDRKDFSQAELLLQEGLALAPAQTGFAMTLARLQVDRGGDAQAVATLQKGLDHAQASADYLAFFAALLQRQARHEDAIARYQAALRLKPANGVWWIGLGLSLQAVNRAADAQDAYRQARATNNLNAELAAFAEQRLRQLR